MRSHAGPSLAALDNACVSLSMFLQDGEQSWRTHSIKTLEALVVASLHCVHFCNINTYWGQMFACDQCCGTQTGTILIIFLNIYYYFYHYFLSLFFIIIIILLYIDEYFIDYWIFSLLDLCEWDKSFIIDDCVIIHYTVVTRNDSLKTWSNV